MLPAAHFASMASVLSRTTTHRAVSSGERIAKLIKDIQQLRWIVSDGRSTVARMVADRDRQTVRSGAGRTVLCAVVLGLASCAPVVHGSFADSGYLSGYGYEIAYQTGTKQVLPPKWGIDNYRPDRGKWIPKEQDEYITKYEFDIDGDGSVDKWITKPIYALRYEHRVHSGVIWLRNIPLPPKLRTKDLRVLLQDYVDQITATTYETVHFQPNKVQIVVEHRPVVAIVEQGPATVAGQPAYMATIETADAEQIKLNPGVRVRRVQLVLMRAPQDEQVENDMGTTAQPPFMFPVVVVAGYSNMPADFQAELDDFHDFLRRLTIGGRSGLMLGTAPAEPPATQPPPAAAPPAPATPPAPSR